MALPTRSPPRPKHTSAPMKAAAWFRADTALKTRSNIAGSPRLRCPRHCGARSAAMPRTASHLARAGNGGRSARAEHPQAEPAGAQVLDFLLQIRRSERVLIEPARRKAHLERARRRRQI